MNDLEQRQDATGIVRQNKEELNSINMTNVFIVVFAVSLILGGLMLFTNTMMLNGSGDKAKTGLQTVVAPNTTKMTEREREENTTPFMQDSLQNRK